MPLYTISYILFYLAMFTAVCFLGYFGYAIIKMLLALSHWQKPLEHLQETSLEMQKKLAYLQRPKGTKKGGMFALVPLFLWYRHMKKEKEFKRLKKMVKHHG